MIDLAKFDLKKGAAWVEDSIIVISGPALAVSGIIAGVDLVTGGNILKSLPGFTLAWAITLLLTLDFQVLALGVRAHRVYLSDKGTKQKIVEIALAVFIAAAISLVSIQMQSIIARVNAENITIDAAAMQLGISTLALIWERSTLVLVLIFMSGWLREHDNKDEETPIQAVQTVPQVVMPSLEEILDRVEERSHARMQAFMERTVETVRLTITEQTNPNMLAIKAPEMPLGGFGENGTNEPVSLEGGFGDVIEALLDREPGLDAQEVATRAGCSITTAKKWMKRLEVPGERK